MGASIHAIAVSILVILSAARRQPSREGPCVGMRQSSGFTDFSVGNANACRPVMKDIVTFVVTDANTRSLDCVRRSPHSARDDRSKGVPEDQSMDCNSLPGLKRTALPGGMETSAPVRGLRPMPVLRGRTLNTPKPRSSMRSPLASDFFMLSKTVSTANSALVLVMPVLLTTSLMISSLITLGSHERIAERAPSA